MYNGTLDLPLFPPAADRGVAKSNEKPARAPRAPAILTQKDARHV